jgi:competence protein ComEC
MKKFTLSLALVFLLTILLSTFTTAGAQTPAPSIPSFKTSGAVIAVDNAITSIDLLKKDPTVYITKTGEKYHRSGCRYLKKSKIAIKLSKAKKRGYKPCKVCKPPKK